MTLQNRNILVTGAGGGLGRDIVLACGRAGAHVILSDFNEETVQASLAALQAAGGSGEVRLADLSDPESIAALGAGLDGPLHGLINNGAIATGIGGIGYRDIEIETWDRVMQVNVRGTWLMIRACADALIASGSGRVVNLASDTALWGAQNLLAYTSSKGAVMAMTRSLAREMGPDGVGLTTIAPGILTTESTDYVPEARHTHYETGRAVPGKQGTGEVAEVAAFLVSEPAITLTGQTLPVDHGFVFN
ncbi:SDR family oxidoreductase [Pseudooceanicola algae]|uniref:Pyridoxal 4-dehydrogenase n=1 Tax=Pseudooceanicola algae TaxID=1537215 RepID=A0A418SJX0_9RHOB|nr:SDR family oxidoreductase [Pseudooceanicola algae]QPM92229.1 Pyridoxal 4-dehydrogenase [Pseudooceanicola algae]